VGAGEEDDRHDGQRPRRALAVSVSGAEFACCARAWKEEGMSDRDAIVQRLIEGSDEFRRLRAEHQAHEEELAALQGRPFLSSEQQWRVSELKKLKLIAKDHMETMIRQHQHAAHLSA
jgi:hypothetical protein